MSIKPILFNTEMVRAILDSRKTVTRRAVKPQPAYSPNMGFVWKGAAYGTDLPPTINGAAYNFRCASPCHPGDILYVRETWYYETFYEDTDNAADLPSGKRSWRYVYKADKPDYPTMPGHWRPSIHMPREAARIFLRVTDVRVERLQEITEEQALKEGVPEDLNYPLDNSIYCPVCKGEGLIGAVHPVSLGYMEVDCPNCNTPIKRFANLWNSTIKPKDRTIYSWEANPWVFVTSFERCEKPKEW